VRVEASILQDARGPINKHTALWMHTIENAVAALGERENREGKTIAVEQSISTVFDAGCFENFGIKRLTNFRGKYDVHRLPSTCWSDEVKAYFECSVYKKTNERLTNGHLILAAGRRDVSNLIRIPDFPYSHSFTVIGAYSKLDRQGRERGPVTTDYLTLRNPWAYAGLGYALSGELRLEKHLGRFDIKSKDFYNHFSYTFFTPSANDLFTLEKNRSDFSLQVRAAIIKIKTETSLSELTFFRHKYELYKDLVIELENLLLLTAPHLLDPEQREALQRLLEMKQQRHTDLKVLQAVETSITARAGYDFCDAMDNEKMKFDILVQAYAHRYAALITTFSQKATQLQTELSSGEVSMGVFLAFTHLQQEEVAISSLAASLTALDKPINLRALTALQAQLNEVGVLINSEEYQQYVTRHQERITSVLEDAIDISKAPTGATAEAIRTHEPERKEWQQLERDIKYVGPISKGPITRKGFN
jgi:hypothetical protein